MARASGVTLEIAFDALPLFDGVAEIAGANRSGGLGSNEEHFGPGVAVEQASESRSELRPLHLIYDPQTSGGLFVAVSGEATADVERAFASVGVPAWRIGRAAPAIPQIHVRMV
jgi:selenide,water dikinase